MSPQDVSKESRRLRPHFSVHQFVNETRAPLSRSLALKEGENSIRSAVYDASPWINCRLNSDEGNTEKADLLPFVKKTSVYHYGPQPPNIPRLSASLLTLKEWGEPVTADEEYSLEELEEFQNGIKAEAQTTTSDLALKRKQDFANNEGPKAPPKRRRTDDISLFRLIPQPHMHSSPFKRYPLSVNLPPYLEAQPLYITPYNEERLLSVPKTARFAWIIPVRGQLPWGDATPASVLPDTPSIQLAKGQQLREIHWSPDSLLDFWNYLLKMQNGGICGPLGISLHLARKKQPDKKKKPQDTKKPIVPSTSMTSQGKHVNDNLRSLSAIDYVKVYHDAVVQPVVRTILYNFSVKFQEGGSIKRVNVLRGARLVLLDECGESVMIL